MSRQHIVLEAPARAGPYSRAVVASCFVFVSGQGPVDPGTGTMAADLSRQARQALLNMEAILKCAGSGLSEVVKVNAYLADLADFDCFNAVYSTFFKGDLPVRTTVGCALNSILFEVDRVAVLADDRRPPC